MARSLAEDRDLNIASPIIESQVRPPSTESILDDPAYSQNAGNWYCGPKRKGRFCATGASCACDSQSTEGWEAVGFFSFFFFFL